jgi:hypothetical protein
MRHRTDRPVTESGDRQTQHVAGAPLTEGKVLFHTLYSRLHGCELQPFLPLSSEYARSSFTGPVIILWDHQGENNVKVKKAAKRLSRVEAMLSGVLNGYASDIAEVREPLEAAAAAVKRARSAIDSNQSSSNQKVSAKSQPVVVSENWILLRPHIARALRLDFLRTV